MSGKVYLVLFKGVYSGEHFHTIVCRTYKAALRTRKKLRKIQKEKLGYIDKDYYIEACPTKITPGQYW